MNSYDRTFEQALRDKIKETRDRVLEELAFGIPTFDLYNKRVGYLDALKDLDAEIEEVKRKIAQ